MRIKSNIKVRLKKVESATLGTAYDIKRIEGAVTVLVGHDELEVGTRLSKEVAGKLADHYTVVVTE